LKNIFRAVLIAALTILLLVLFLRNSDLANVWTLIRSTSIPWLILGLATNVVALFCRAERWRTLIDPDAPPPFYPTFFATAIGFMSSAVLPVRAGDVVRPALLARRTNVRFSKGLGTVLTERVLDLLSILTLFLAFVAISILRPGEFSEGEVVFIKSAGMIAGALFAAMTSFILSLYFFHGFVRRMHEWLGRFLPRRVSEVWMAFFDAFVTSLAIARHGRGLRHVLLMTAIIWAALTSQFIFVTYALDHPLPPQASFFITGMAILGMAIPTPGGIGGFHKMCQIVLTRFYDFDIDSSVAVALIFHVVGTAPVIIVGLLLFLREGLTWRQLARIGEKVEE
jgi:hypothetical protein